MKPRILLSAGALALAALASSLCLAPRVQAKEWKTVTIGTEAAFEPWNLTKPDGTIDGFEPELFRDLCARAKLQCKFIAQDFDGLIPGLQAGKFDVIMDSLSITDERKQTIAFSKPYANTPAEFTALKGSPLAKLPGTGTTVKLTGDSASDTPTIDALRAAVKGKTIGVQISTNFASFVEKNFKDVAADIKEYKTSAEHDLDLLAGRLDLAFDDATYFGAVIGKPENAEMTVTGPEIGGPVWGEGEALGFRKADADLKAKFDEVIQAALADGTVKKLSLKWFKVDVSP